jgi:hypothetical protein
MPPTIALVVDTANDICQFYDYTQSDQKRKNKDGLPFE